MTHSRAKEKKKKEKRTHMKKITATHKDKKEHMEARKDTNDGK